MANLWEVPDDDDDIFADGTGDLLADEEHVYDGSLCPSCGIVHNSPDIPDEVTNSANRLLASLPPHMRKNTKVMPHMGAADLMGRLAHLIARPDTSTKSTLLHAMAQILDEMTNGKVELRARMWGAHSAWLQCLMASTMLDQIITATHKVQDTADISSISSNSDFLDESYRSCASFIAILLHRQADTYSVTMRLLATESGFDPDLLPDPTKPLEDQATELMKRAYGPSFKSLVEIQKLLNQGAAKLQEIDLNLAQIQELLGD